MASSSSSKPLSSAALFLCLNLLFFTMVSSTSTCPSLPTCSIDTLKLSVCANLLGLVVVGNQYDCCSLIEGLVDLEASVCLCTALKANILGIITVDLDVALTTILNNCKRTKPSCYACSRY